MIYKEYKLGPIILHTIKCDKFKQCHMEIIFRNEIDKKNLTKRSMLVEMLTENNKTYPKRRDLILKLEDLYNTFIYSINSKVGKEVITSFCTDFIDPKYTKGDYLKSVIELSFDMLNNPNVKNNEFDKETFELVKKRIALDINSINEDPERKSIMACLEAMDKSSISSLPINGFIEDLEQITPSNLYEYYKQMLNHDLIDIYIIGSIDMEEVYKLMCDYSKFNIINNHDINLYVNNTPRKKVKISEGYMDISQAHLTLALNLTDLTDFERDYVLRIYNLILGGGGLTSKLYTYLREENSLCYTVNSTYQKYDNLILIYTAINKENYNLAVKLIKKALKEMQTGKFTEEDINDAKEIISSSLNSCYDNPGRIVDNYLFQNIAGLEPVEIRKEKYKTITKKDIVTLAKKVKLNTIYFLSDKKDKNGDNNG